MRPGLLREKLDEIGRVINLYDDDDVHGEMRRLILAAIGDLVKAVEEIEYVADEEGWLS